MIRAAHAVYFTALGLWVGAIAVLGAIVAPTTFRTAPSREDAGRIFGSILESFGIAELVLAGLVLVSAWILRKTALRGSRTGWIRVGMAILLSVVCCVSVLGLNPAVRRTAPHRESASASFDRLHAWATRLMAARLVAGLALLAYSGAAIRPTDGV